MEDNDGSRMETFTCKLILWRWLLLVQKGKDSDSLRAGVGGRSEQGRAQRAL